MAPKKKAGKKGSKKKPSKPVKKKSSPKRTAKKAAAPKAARKRKTIPCICIENENGWFCMKRKPNGELVKCDGPFATQQICEEHTCVDK